jgi:hypothetical protein
MPNTPSNTASHSVPVTYVEMHFEKSNKNYFASICCSLLLQDRKVAPQP